MYPKEILFPLDGHNHLLLRVIVHIHNNTTSEQQASYSAEVDLIMAESRKIYHHIGMFYGHSDEDDCVKSALNKTHLYLES